MPEILFSKKASDQLLKFPVIDNHSLKKIDKAILELSDYLDINNLWIKKLKGRYSDLFCLKVGRYRIKFFIQEEVIYITEIELRKDAYR